MMQKKLNEKRKNVTKELNRKILEEINNDKKDFVTDIFTALILFSLFIYLAFAIAPRVGISF